MQRTFTWILGATAALMFTAGLTTPRPAAALVVGPNFGLTDLTTHVTLPGGAGPLFDGFGRLVTPGFGYPTVLNPFGAASVENFCAGGIAVPLGCGAAPDPIDGFGGAVGGAIVERAFGGPGITGGLLWSPFFLSDGAPAGKVSRIDSVGSVDLFNPLPVPVFGVGGVWLAVTGTLPLGKYAAASVRGSIGLLPPIDVTFMSDGLGGGGSLVDQVLDNTAFTFLLESLIIGGPLAGGTNFLAAGVSLYPGLFVIPPGGTINVTATISLVADPDASIIFVDLPPAIRAKLPFNLFGAGGVIPEPSTLAVLLGGLGVLVFVRRRRRP
ncbi:MAG: PEP-CTERM sorting domain-containing protein [Alphaproteobacteria bacterium]|nr:PEP-CTERM sorting domain-containing protein [Alphaproteobacteria bacterium]